MARSLKQGGFGTTLILALLFVVLTVAMGLGVARYGEQVSWLDPLLDRPTQTTGPVVIQDIEKLTSWPR